MAKVIDGNYDDRPGKSSNSIEHNRHNYDFEEIEKGLLNETTKIMERGNVDDKSQGLP